MLDALTLDQARIFLAVAETGSFSAAARRVRRVQSAVSQSVLALERTLGTELFDRSGRLPALTLAGKALLADARAMIRSADAFRAKAEAFAGGVEPTLAIAVSPLFPTDPVVAALRAVDARYPATRITVFAGGLGRPERLLRAGTVSLAIYAAEITASNDLEREFLRAVEMVPVAAASHPLAVGGGPVARGDLAEAVQLVLGDDPGSATASRGILSRRTWWFDDLKSRLDFLLAGAGWCHLPTHLADPLLADGRLVRLAADGVGYALSAFAVHMPGRPPGPAAQALLAEIRRLVLPVG